MVLDESNIRTFLMVTTTRFHNLVANFLRDLHYKIAMYVFRNHNRALLRTNEVYRHRGEEYFLTYQNWSEHPSRWETTRKPAEAIVT